MKGLQTVAASSPEASKQFLPSHSELDLQKRRLARAKSQKILARRKSVKDLVHGWTRDEADAESVLRKSLEVRKEMYGIDHEAVGHALNQLGSVLSDQGRYVVSCGILIVMYFLFFICCVFLHSKDVMCILTMLFISYHVLCIP